MLDKGKKCTIYLVVQFHPKQERFISCLSFLLLNDVSQTIQELKITDCPVLSTNKSDAETLYYSIIYSERNHNVWIQSVKQDQFNKMS